MPKRSEFNLDEIRESRRIKHKTFRPSRNKELDKVRIGDLVEEYEHLLDVTSREFDIDYWADYWADYGNHYNMLKNLIKTSDGCRSVLLSSEWNRPIRQLKEWTKLVPVLKTVQELCITVARKLVYKWLNRVYNDYADLDFMSDDIIAERGRISLTEGKGAGQKKKEVATNNAMEKLSKLVETGKYPFLKDYLERRKQAFNRRKGLGNNDKQQQ